jgi:polyisoprenyl-teichoic acid--peptidoglycan teichoic acid transferase
MADRGRRKARELDDEVAPTGDREEVAGSGGQHRDDRTRKRRTEMSRRERRRRRRRAAKAARRGDRGKSTSAGGASVGVAPTHGSDLDLDEPLPTLGRRQRASRRKRAAARGIGTVSSGEGATRGGATSEHLFDQGTRDPGRSAEPSGFASSIAPVDRARVARAEPAREEPQAPTVEPGWESPPDAEPEWESPQDTSPSTHAPVPTEESSRARPSLRVTVAVLLLALVGALGLVAMQLGWLEFARDIVTAPGVDEEPLEPPEDGWQPTFLLASVDDSVSGGELRSLAVLATDRREERGTVLLVPTTILTDVPGFGSFTLREAWDLGGHALVAVTVDNLLGVRIGGVLAVDGEGWAEWFDQPDGAVIDVRSRIVPREGTGQPQFEAGAQRFGPREISGYVLVHGQGESELDVLPRTRQVLDALLSAIDEDPAVLDAAVDAARTFPGTATPDRIRTVLDELADARARDELTTVTMPVIPLGSGEDDMYRSDVERVDALMDDRFAASRDDRASADRLAVQILNGMGQPGIGQEVAERLADGNYRIALTGNADHFGYRTTRIIVYSEEREILLAAQDVQERLGGIGTIERSGTPQSVVDLTIVVGHDFR